MIQRLWAHIRTLWPRWTLLPPLPFVLWPAYCFLRGEYGRWELWALAALGLLMPYWNARTKKLFVGIAPLGVVGPMYDAMRFVQNLGITPERVHICDLRAAEISLFGITYHGQRTTVHDWLQDHAILPLDLFFAVPYGTFIGACILLGVYLYVKDYPAMRRFTTAFFVLNLLGFITYHVFPAAPPWWYHAHGCALPDLEAARPSVGPNLARVDAFLHYGYFSGFYGRSHDIFGAMPSLHVAYPALILIEGWRSFGKLLRAVAIVFFLAMCGGAVYLDHHWVLDVCVGLLYTVIVASVLRRVIKSEPTGRSASNDAAPRLDVTEAAS